MELFTTNLMNFTRHRNAQSTMNEFQCAARCVTAIGWSDEKLTEPENSERKRKNSEQSLQFLLKKLLGSDRKVYNIRYM